MTRETLRVRRFTPADQLAFSRLSGDSNPIHLDAVAARRTLAGQCIVHGVHGLLWALDVLAGHGILATALKVRFQKPIHLDEDVACRWDGEKGNVALMVGDVKAVDIALTLGTPPAGETLPAQAVAARIAQADRNLAQSAALGTQPFLLHGDPAPAGQLFPAAVRAYGALAVNELAALSYAVGMETPGLHSLFAGLRLEFLAPARRAATLAVTDTDPRFQRLALAVAGQTLQAEIEAFQRPAPLRLPATADLAARVRPGAYRQVRALVVGGSRGLGEISAKLLAAGGAQVFITYSQGAEEAQRVAEDIRRFGGRCTALPLTIAGAAQLPAGLPPVNQLYFFATPKIFGKRGTAFDEALYRGFRQVYVEGFESLCRQLLAGGQRCSVLYPSSVALDRPLPELAEYARAKADGEALCARLDDGSGKLAILAPRLPRTATDQTQALLQAAAADPVDVMLPLLREMTRLLAAHPTET